MSRARHKAGGGRTDEWVSGNPDVKKEAEGKEPYDEGDEKKHGGRAKKRAAGGRAAINQAVGKVLGLMTGGAVKPRMDRPGRKMGGRVGSDRSPLSSANRSTSAESMPKENGGN